MVPQDAYAGKEASPEYIVHLVFLMQDKTGASPMGWTKIIVIAQFAFQIAENAQRWRLLVH